MERAKAASHHIEGIALEVDAAVEAVAADWKKALPRWQTVLRWSDAFGARRLDTVGAKDLSTAFAPPEATLVKTEEKRVVFRVPRDLSHREARACGTQMARKLLGSITWRPISPAASFGAMETRPWSTRRA